MTNMGYGYMTTNGIEEENPKVAQYSVSIIDRPDNEFIILTAKGKFKGVTLKHQKLINRTELASANYNLMALCINRIAKSFRSIIEQYEIEPVLKLSHIYLPETWSTYEAPDWLLEERKHGYRAKIAPDLGRNLYDNSGSHVKESNVS